MESTALKLWVQLIAEHPEGRSLNLSNANSSPELGRETWFFVQVENWLNCRHVRHLIIILLALLWFAVCFPFLDG